MADTAKVLKEIAKRRLLHSALGFRIDELLEGFHKDHLGRGPFQEKVLDRTGLNLSPKTRGLVNRLMVARHFRLVFIHGQEFYSRRLNYGVFR